ncbi:Thiol:disulfide interchange protein DsbD [Abditibacterium utsteinense]|uniref:Thiol:disulfide interchange protein DsbD n=1 Tax=Abditibacterium utsteinense TaxID=1960156 RepID=A0A2S8STY8_9BACT|nr:cytochrome c biogenesis protein CcdA [Abditibacterium utsteinense]PQV64246.1 Thiol:disulfide interchange protein DsbD [Abditibacterium utsteinense]
MSKPRLLLFLVAFFVSLSLPQWASAQNPVKWSASLEPSQLRSGEGGRIVVNAKIAAPWYIYAPSTPPGGPNPTKIEMLPSSSLSSSGKVAQPTPAKHFDEGFQMNTETFAKSVAFGLPVRVKSGGGPKKATVRVRFQACNARLCLPPKTVEIPLTFSVQSGAARAGKLSPDASVPPQSTKNEVAAPPKIGGTTQTTTKEAAPANSNANASSQGLLAYAGVAFGAGLLALLTPCVFPMIPITVSFFTKRSESQGARISGPVAFCAGIIGTFTVVGVAASVVFGAAGISRFATNPYVNLALAGLFVLLALNLFGVFELTVPSGILNRVSPNAAGGNGGLLTPLLMGFAFTLTSFTCTVPFVGTALFAAATGGWIYPAIGMLAFSTAFSLPFFLLALFPGWLAKMPRAGSWLVSTKAFMGFLELAAALKFLSTVDLVWQLGWLTRPVFLALWFAIALLSALYLLQMVRLPRDEKVKLGPFRLGLGAAMIGVSACLLGAMNGSRLGDFDAYLPPDDYGKNAPLQVTNWLKNDLVAAQKRAKESGKPLLINFTGYACTNCRLMEKNVLPHQNVIKELENYIAVELYTDGTDAKSREFNRFQQEKFNTVAIPLYAVVEPNLKERGRLEGLERDPAKFAAFLERNRGARRVASAK